MSAHRERLSRQADEDLMRLVARADADAFEVLYDRHVNAAYSLAYRISGQAVLADDITQEALLSVWRCANRYDARLGSVRSWMLSVVHNRAIDQLRRVTRHTSRQDADEYASTLLAAADDTETAALGSVASEEMLHRLDRLPDEQRRVVDLSFYSGYSHSEIASMLDIPLGTVKGRMRSALSRLSQAMSGAGA